MTQSAKKHLLQTITVFPSLGKVDGDNTFGTEVNLTGTIFSKSVVVVDRAGNQVESQTTIILSEEAFGHIKESDEIYHSWLGRRPVQKIDIFPDLHSNAVDHLEVRI